MVLTELNMSLEDIRQTYPDTYDFLMSLRDSRSELFDY